MEYRAHSQRGFGTPVIAVLKFRGRVVDDVPLMGFTYQTESKPDLVSQY